MLFLCLALFVALCVITWVGAGNDQCPNFANGGDGSAVGFQSAFVYEITNSTYKKRDESALTASDCVIYGNVGYGINEFNTSLTVKTGYALGFSFSADGTSNITLTEYNSTNCLLGTQTGVVLVRNFSLCYTDTENGIVVSRWFQLTPQIPPGYTSPTGPPNFFSLSYYTTDPATSGCGTPLKTFRFANDQKCHQLSSTLYVKAYCNSTTSFEGEYFTSSDCTTGATTLGSNINVGQCYNDPAPGIGLGCVGISCFPLPATKVIFTCSSSSLMFNFAGLFAVLFAVLSLI